MKASGFLLGSTLLLISASSVMAADTQSCNLLGREIALRAVEELNLELDAGMRSKLADIAESSCLDYQAVPTQATGRIQGSDSATGMAVDADLEDADSSLFDLNIIDPEDRVRRPGLKRR